MPRVSCNARTERRTLMMVNGNFHFLDEYDTHSCPYCDCTFNDSSDRDRHVMMKPECRLRHLNDVKAGRKARRELAYKTAGPSSRPHPLASGSGSNTAPIDANGNLLRYNDPRQWSDNGRTCQQPFVERFPPGTAGSPISNEKACPRNLKAYLEACGPLSNPEAMEAAELLMTTGLSGKAQTKHLQSSFYKGKTPWQND
ncbi:hypothetical protein FRC12_008371 [Ceratobasidium sp. 428]|nr:hypothetical protein FRC12_008371 [Ceratobasidium sp. 428]